MNWINVKDRLPQDDDEEAKILFTTFEEPIMMGLFINSRLRGNTDSFWFIGYDPVTKYCGDLSNKQVTHWMQLPQPPRDKE